MLLARYDDRIYSWLRKDFLMNMGGNMFLPNELRSRRETLGVVWMAANYDPEQKGNKKKVSTQDCERADIPKICKSISDPVAPLSLRLSSKLLLGTVRIQHMKAKKLLENAETTLVNLDKFITETDKGYVLPTAKRKGKQITKKDPWLPDIPDFGPHYIDDNMMLQREEDDHFTFSNTPVKFDVPQWDKIVKTGPTVSESSITMVEDLISPRKPIQHPDETEFGPASPSFLKHLGYNDISDIRSNLDKIVLEPILEINEDDVNTATKKLKKRNADGAIKLNEDPNTACTLADNFADDTTAVMTNAKRFMGTQQQDALIDWNVRLETPADGLLIKSKSKRKRKIKHIDHKRILDSCTIRKNIATPETLIRKPVIAGTAVRKVKELYRQPAYIDFTHLARLKSVWRNNTRVNICYKENEMMPPPNSPPGTKVKKPTTLITFPPRCETLPSNDRVGSAASLQSKQPSAASTKTIFINETPNENTAKNNDEIYIEGAMISPRHLSPRISGISQLPQDIDVDVGPELEAVIEQGEIVDVEQIPQCYKKKILTTVDTFETTSFSQTFPTYCTTKRQAAEAAQVALVLHQQGRIHLSQNKPFGEVKMSVPR